MGIWNYELLPNSDEPMPKFYVDMNGENDLQNAQGIAKFMQHIGLTATGEGFIKTIQEYLYEALPTLSYVCAVYANLSHYSPGVDLEQTTDIIQYVSFAWSKGGPYFSVYYHSSY